MFTSVRHPQSNMAERFISEVIKFLRTLINNQSYTTWPNYLSEVENCINNVPNTSTWFSPLFLQKRINPERPWTTEQVSTEEFNKSLMWVRYKLRKATLKRQARADAKIRKITKFNVGDLVILKNLRQANRTRDILNPYDGPFVISESFSNCTYMSWDFWKQIN